MEHDEVVNNPSIVPANKSSELEEHICAGQRALRDIRCRVSGTMLLAGAASGLVVLLLAASQRSFPRMPNNGARAQMLEVLTCACVYTRFVCLSLAPLAGDVVLTRAVMAVDVAFLLSSYAAQWLVWGHSVFLCHEGCPSCAKQVAFEACLGLNMLLFLCATALAMRCTTGARMQARMWDTIALWVVVKTVASFVRSLDILVECGAFSSSWWWVLGGQAAFLVVRRPECRQALHARLHRLLQVHVAQASAAGIAGLVGDCTVEEALVQAKARFRCVSLAKVTQEDVVDNKPNPSLFALTMPTKFGKCDAFVSHSWHDDSAAKWTALQSWRSAFLQRHAREPTVWIDKYCIDQNNIEADLRSLPVFISSCSRLVMLCGPTYLSRLWCIMEIFTYVHVGGKVSDIEFVPVLRPGREALDLRELKRTFELFTAQECTCFLAKDKEKMLGIIHAAFGGMHAFNDAVRAFVSAAGVHCGAVPCSQGCLSSSCYSSDESHTSDGGEEGPDLC